MHKERNSATKFENAFAHWGAEQRAETRQGLYFPIYICLNSTGRAGIEAILAHPGPNGIRLDSHERRALGWHLEQPGADIGESIHAVVYQPADAAMDINADLYRIVEIGAAVQLAVEQIDPLDAIANAGVGPITGIIDEGIGFLNQRFCRQAGSRFEAVWMQAGMAIATGLVETGKVFQRGDINAYQGKDEASSYAAINTGVYPIEPHHSTNMAQTHGTHVTDIACGGNPGSDMEDVDIIAVQLPPRSIRETAGDRLEVNILRGLRFIIQRAAMMQDGGNPRPLVINISLGYTAGPKDGSGLLESRFAAEMDLYTRMTGGQVRLVLAFGNAYRNNQVAVLEPETAGTTETIHWRLQPDDRMASYLELRADTGFEVAITPPASPAGDFVAPPAGHYVDVLKQGKLIGRIYNETADPDGRHCYILTTFPTNDFGGEQQSPAGAWAVAIRGATGAVSLQVQRGDTPVGYRRHGRQSYLEHPDAHGFDALTHHYDDPANSPITRNGTHSAMVPPDDDRIYAVGAAYGQSSGAPNRPTLYTAAGTLNTVLSHRQEPTISATGDASPIRLGVLASGTRSGSTTRYSGTSVAAPEVTRRLIMDFRETPQASPAQSLNNIVAASIATTIEAERAQKGAGWLSPLGAR